MSYNCPFLDPINGNPKNGNLKNNFEKDYLKLSLDYENLKKENEQLKIELRQKKNIGFLFFHYIFYYS